MNALPKAEHQADIQKHHFYTEQKLGYRRYTGLVLQPISAPMLCPVLSDNTLNMHTGGECRVITSKQCVDSLSLLGHSLGAGW